MATKRYIGSSATLDMAAPYDVSQWCGALVNGIFGVAKYDVSSGQTESFIIEGITTLSKVSSESWAQGDDVYWDNTNKTCTNVALGNTLIGNATEASTGATGSVRLRGAAQTYVVARPVEVISSSAAAASCASTAVDEVLASFTIPAGTLGVNSILQIEPLWTFGSSANNKIPKVKVAGSTVYTATRTTSVKEGPLVVLACRNSLASQIQPYDYAYLQAGSGAPATYAIDFSVAVTVQITGQRANSGDALTLEYYRCLHFVGD